MMSLTTVAVAVMFPDQHLGTGLDDLTGRFGAGSRVLVFGAGGGVSTLTVQLAAARGAEVWATCVPAPGTSFRHLARQRHPTIGPPRSISFRPGCSTR